FSAALASVVARLLAAADELYARVGAGVAALPLGCRPGINAARFMYADIGHAVRRAGHDSVSRRAVVPASRKVWLLLRALATLRPSAAGEASALPALSANDFLVAAVAATATPMPPDRASRGIGDRLVGVIELFDRLERKDRAVLMRRPTGA
ncbi:MAG: squalene/phytoene synthase family protein, partial [Gammaproteobacteria bacterium]|nr:squalene/phytoene synthase family protein [Gammaproteobacteria bacterium]